MTVESNRFACEMRHVTNAMLLSADKTVCAELAAGRTLVNVFICIYSHTLQSKHSDKHDETLHFCICRFYTT